MASLPGPQVQNTCPSHPDEPVTGLCGCGTFFCRRCSPSSVFCGKCYRECLQSHSGSACQITAHEETAPVSHRHTRPRPLGQRLLFEMLVITILLVAAVSSVFTLTRNPVAIDENDSFFIYGINDDSEPTQKSAEFFRATMYTSDGADVTLTSDTSYSISAKVESVTAYDDAMGETIPYDLLLAWGRMADEDVDGKLTWEQSDRRGTVTGSLGGSSGPDVDDDYVVSHVSNSHVVPANTTIAQALDTIEPGDIVRIEGRLVDVRMVNGHQVYTVTTSKSRTDQGDGACEIIYVERIRINSETFS